MADRTKEVAGALSLSEIENEIKFEEAKSFEFLTSRVQNDKDNLVDFKKLALGNFPQDLKLTADTDPAPDGYKLLPDSPIAMVVGGSRKNVKAWRKQ